MRDLRGFSVLAPIALALSFGALTTSAMADDPRDPTMTPEAIARDRETIRRLNNEQLAYVRERDAQYAQGWRDYAAANGRGSVDKSPSQRAYADARRDYERRLAEWRKDVAACRAGDYDRCAR